MNEPNNNNSSNYAFNTVLDSSQNDKPAYSRPSYTRLWWSLGVSLAIAIACIIAFLSAEADAVTSILFAVFAFSFSCSLFFEDSATRSVIEFMGMRGIRFPGLIWEFSLDGFIWLIGMKLLFAVIGFLFGIICAVLGVIIGFVIAPFALPFAIIGYLRDIREGN